MIWVLIVLRIIDRLFLYNVLIIFGFLIILIILKILFAIFVLLRRFSDIII